MRKSTLFLLGVAIEASLVIALMIQGMMAWNANKATIERRAAMVRELKLTDLALFTEARYTRHPSQADLHSAFQDHPTSFEHFPAGSFVRPTPVK